ncbi:hypothetical protein Tsubulata_003194, partial [Turnera subulata]
MFGNPYGNPEDYKAKDIPDDFGTLPLSKTDQMDPPSISMSSSRAQPAVANTQSVGSWELDCFAHSVLYDTDTAQLKALELHTDTWCSSGGLTIEGNFVSTGGFQGGANTVRYLETCDNCNWREFPTALAEPRWCVCHAHHLAPQDQQGPDVRRHHLEDIENPAASRYLVLIRRPHCGWELCEHWRFPGRYSTQATLPDGGFIVVGGRNAFSYEYIPREGQRNSKAFFFNLLKQTSDPEENNLYPFVYLSTDGNVFVFANNRSVLLNPISNQVVREFPQLPGGHRNYPPSAMAALLPIMLNSRGKEIPAEVLICGGSAHIDSYGKAGNNIFYTGLKDCGRLKITDENPEWHRDLMPAPRIMGDAVLLPTGEILMLNGAIRGTSGWGFAREPNFKPVLYNPRAVKGQRFRELAPSTIPRMYHSTSTLLPDGKVLVSGSNTNNGYIYDAMFPTELRVEKFSPPYLDFSGGKQRPTIQQAPDRISYAEKFDIQVAPLGEPLNKKEVLVTMYAPAFTTHGVSMNQRLISLVKEQVKGGSTITTVAPPSGKIAPPGYYLLFVVYKGIPSLFMASNPFSVFNEKHLLGPHELFGNPYGNPNDYKEEHIPDDYGTLPLSKSDQIDAKPAEYLPVANTRSDGSWELVSLNSGVSAMHTILLPKTNKVLMYDATIWKISKLELPPGHCRVINQQTNEQDCFAHSILYDIETAELKPLEGGANTVRYLETCETCNWREFPTALAEPRWYSTQATLPDGGFIVVGGRNAFSYEYIPQEGQSNAKAFFFNLLKQTNDKDENNLYPFVYLSTDGNVFIFANNRAVLLNPKSNKIVKEFPQLPGGHRNYPTSALSALLPIMLNSKGRKVIPAEVLICGGSAHIDSYTKAGENIFYTALEDCGRLRITDENPVWKRDLMPSPRVMGDAVLLPAGEVLMLNGAKRGCSGWGFARDPNYKPVLYNPRGKKGQRFRELAPSDIARMYHSTSTLLPDGKVLVSGSNTNNGYIYDAILESRNSRHLTWISLAESKGLLSSLHLTGLVMVSHDGEEVTKKQMLVTMYAPAFTTHGVSMNQRLISLVKAKVNNDNGEYYITAVAPPSGKVAPPGYYMLFVVFEGIPSVAHWVQIL